jgi:fructose-1,6-bisphosphatase/inositol monophosphatase family enzyme
VNTNEIVALLENAALDSGRNIVETIESGSQPEVWTKADNSLVMSVDIESQKRILAILGDSTLIVAEEDESTHSRVSTAESYFLIDPLDGTTSCRRFWNVRGGQVGFGPLVGYVEKGRLTVAVFYSVPHRTLYTAVLGEGLRASVVDFDAAPAPVERTARDKLTPVECSKLALAGVLFYVGNQGEARVVEHLRKRNAVENFYRFGGFANDCIRLSRGAEQITVQFAVKPWDYAAVLFAHEAGLQVTADPFGRRIPFEDWKIQMNNPVVITQRSLSAELFKELELVKL